MRGIAFLRKLEHFLVAVILPDILDRQSFSDYRDNCFANTDVGTPTVRQLDNMCFKPLLKYIKRIEDQLQSMAAEWLASAQTPADHRQLEKLGRVQSDCHHRYEKLKLFELEWISDQTRNGKQCIVSYPWDFCFFSFLHFIDDIFMRAKALKDKGTDWQMVHHYGRIARFNNRHPADRLRTILKEIRWCQTSYAL